MRYLLYTDIAVDWLRVLSGRRILDIETAAIFGRERARLRRSGNIIPDLDILVGASALRHNVTLLTSNRRDFERIEGLTIESV